MNKFLLAYGWCLQKYQSTSYFSWWIQILTNSIALFVSCQFTLCFSPLNICYSAVTCKDIFYWHNLLGWTVTPLFHLSPNRWLFKMTLPLWPFAGTVSFCDKDNTFKGCTTSSVHMNIQLCFFSSEELYWNCAIIHLLGFIKVVPPNLLSSLWENIVRMSNIKTSQVLKTRDADWKESKHGSVWVIWKLNLQRKTLCSITIDHQINSLYTHTHCWEPARGSSIWSWYSSPWHYKLNKLCPN